MRACCGRTWAAARQAVDVNSTAGAFVYYRLILGGQCSLMEYHRVFISGKAQVAPIVNRQAKRCRAHNDEHGQNMEQFLHIDGI